MTKKRLVCVFIVYLVVTCMLATSPLVHGQDEEIVYDVEVWGAGDEAHTNEIDCDGHAGTVVVRENVRYRWRCRRGDEVIRRSAERHPSISLGYTGTGSDDCCWLQFIWSEIIITKVDADENETSDRMESRIRTTGGSYDLTTDPDNPNYNVDSASEDNPCYDARGARNRNDDSITIYDRPASSNPLAREERRDATVTKIESKDHFDSYLVCDGQVCYKISWTVTYTLSRRDDRTWGEEEGQVYTIDEPDTSGERPNEAQMDKLNELYPGQDLLPE
jgi:hypothetical protein